MTTPFNRRQFIEGAAATALGGSAAVFAPAVHAQALAL